MPLYENKMYYKLLITRKLISVFVIGATNAPSQPRSIKPTSSKPNNPRLSIVTSSGEAGLKPGTKEECKELLRNLTEQLEVLLTKKPHHKANMAGNYNSLVLVFVLFFYLIIKLIKNLQKNDNMNNTHNIVLICFGFFLYSCFFIYYKSYYIYIILIINQIETKSDSNNASVYKVNYQVLQPLY